MTSNLAILMDLLAQIDALFSVPRVYSSPATCLPSKPWAATYERRADYPDKGIDYTGGGSDEARKQVERRLDELKTAGLVKLHTRGGRRCGVSLTRYGDDVARHFAASKMLWESWPILDRIERLIDADVCRGCLVREDDLAGVDYGTPEASRALSDMEADILPLAAAGLLNDAADSQGRIWYGLTKSGERRPSKAPTEPENLPEYQSGWCDVHSDLLEKALADRMNWEPATPSHIAIPVSCGIGPKRSWHDLELTT